MQKDIHENLESFRPELLGQFYNIYHHNFAQMYSLIWTGISGEGSGPWAFMAMDTHKNTLLTTLDYWWSHRWVLVVLTSMVSPGNCKLKNKINIFTTNRLCLHSQKHMKRSMRSFHLYIGFLCRIFIKVYTSICPRKSK